VAFEGERPQSDVFFRGPEVLWDSCGLRQRGGVISICGDGLFFGGRAVVFVLVGVECAREACSIVPGGLRDFSQSPGPVLSSRFPVIISPCPNLSIVTKC
jgi:hypothetical protein